MSTNHGFITVRANSSRLPQKCFFTFPARNLLQHNILRAQHFGFTPIVCTSTDSSDDLIAKIAQDMNVGCFRGSLNNKLKRWSDCAEHFQLESFHTLDSDDPYIDFNLAKMSLKQLREYRLDLVKPSVRSSQGAATVGYSFSTTYLRSITQEIPQESDTEMIDVFIEAKTDSRIETIFEESQDNNRVRLTVDYLEDWVLVYYLESLFSYSGNRADIDKHFKDNPNLHKVNFFRNREWSDRQRSAASKSVKELLNG